MKNYMAISLLLVISLFAVGCSKKESVVERNNSSEMTDLDVSEQQDIEIGTENSSVDSVTEATGHFFAENETSSDKCAVYVCGAVKCPGVYYLNRGSLKQEALLLAGGFLEEAADWYINLAEKVTDGEKLYVPFEREFDENVSHISIESTLGGNKPAEENAQTDANGTRLVNINTAGEEELTTINGIGKSRAEAIIKYREEQGAFNTISDICKVDGIKEGLFNKIKEYITVN